MAKLEMRGLNGQDTFLLLPIVAKLGISDAIKYVEKQRGKYADEELSQEEIDAVGAKLFAKVLEIMLADIGKIQNDINKLLAELCNTTQKEIKGLDFAEYNVLIVELFTQEGFKSFFKHLYSSLK